MRILVFGSRTWTDEERIFDALAEEYHCWEHEPCELGAITVVHGACPRGADEIADRLARRHGYGVEPHPADWARYKKRAGYIRNAEMAKLDIDLGLGFIVGDSPGSTMMANILQAADIPVKIWRV